MTACLPLSFRGVVLYLLLPILLVLLLPILQAKSPVLSSEGLFSVSDLGFASTSSKSFSRLLATYERQFLVVTGFPRGDAPPVVVMLHASTEHSASLPSLRVDVMEGGAPRVRLDLVQGSEGDPQVRQLIATSLLLREYYGTSSPVSGTCIPRFPSWVTCGLARLCTPDSKAVDIPTSYLRGAAPPEIEAFLTQRAPEGGAQTISDLYEAMAACLLKAGLQGNGGEKFRDWISHHVLSSKSSNSLSPWPPGWQMRPVERRWLLLMAGNQEKESKSTTLMTTADTLAAYDALISSLPTPGHSLGQLRKEKGADYLIEQFSASVASLRFRANPMALPIIDGTTLFLSKLKRMPEKKVAPAEAELVALRKEILKRSREIEHYLDWYEVAKIPVRSGLFDKYLNSPETIVKKGPVGRYLDAIEARGW